MDESVDASSANKRVGSVRAKNARPTMEIYRPPGLRGRAGIKSAFDSDQASNASSASSRSSGGEMDAQTRPTASTVVTNVCKLSESTIGNAAAHNHTEKLLNGKTERQTVLTIELPAISAPTPPSDDGSVVQSKPKSSPRHVSSAKEPKKKTFTRQEAEEIGRAFQSLNVESVAERELINEFIASEMADESLARCVADVLKRHAIVESRGKQNGKAVARASVALLSSKAPTGAAFYDEMRCGLTRLFDERVIMRVEQPRIWIALLSFACELCASIGFLHDGGIVDVIFDLFAYLLSPDMLDSLRIEELECMLSALLSIGYDLERYCPDRLGALQDALRDAFIDARESWARKMLLLMIELGASGWQLAPDAQDYYFQ